MLSPCLVFYYLLWPRDIVKKKKIRDIKGAVDSESVGISGFVGLPGPFRMIMLREVSHHLKSPNTLRLPWPEEAQDSHVERLLHGGREIPKM